MMRAFDVYLNGRWRDTVFMTHPAGYTTRAEREADVKQSLVNHDGYNPNIIIRESK